MSLDKIYNSEGYCDLLFANGGPNYQYYRKDHLGNNREVWNANGNVTYQRTQYYPSGLPWADSQGTWVQNKKYNGKEFVEAHGLDEYDSSARWYYPAIMRTTTIDPLAEKYYSISPYAWCGNNPVRAVDPDGMEFTDEAWEYVEKLMAEVQRQQDANNNAISEKQALLDKGGLSERRVKSLNNQISNLKNSNSELEQVRSETAVLAGSKQLYDMKVDNSLSVSDKLGNIKLTGKTEWQNGTVLMSIPNSYDLSFISHELKHGFQFETGNFSFNGIKGSPFYDKFDELEAYKRGALFGGTHYNNINELPKEYDKIQDGPASAASYIEQITYRKYNSPYYESRASMFVLQFYVLQRIATLNRAIFRVGGRTYTP